MFLDSYHACAEGLVRISADQGSRFAKEVAGDFNPIHNPGAKRFVVPGDLLFSLVLARYGLSPRMSFSFTGMVGAGLGLQFPDTDAADFEITDTAAKVYLKVHRSGEAVHDMTLAEAFVRNYVAFSGQTFPNVLVPLMREHGVMINPDRPLVIYEGMGFDLQRLDMRESELVLTESILEVRGKRGDVRLGFEIRAGGESVGTGTKSLVLSGLRPFDEASVAGLVAQYSGSMRSHDVA